MHNNSKLLSSRKVRSNFQGTKRSFWQVPTWSSCLNVPLKIFPYVAAKSNWVPWPLAMGASFLLFLCAAPLLGTAPAAFPWYLVLVPSYGWHSASYMWFVAGWIPRAIEVLALEIERFDLSIKILPLYHLEFSPLKHMAYSICNAIQILFVLLDGHWALCGCQSRQHNCAAGCLCARRRLDVAADCIRESCAAARLGGLFFLGKSGDDVTS